MKTPQFKTEAPEFQYWCFTVQFQTLPRTFINPAWDEPQVPLPGFGIQLLARGQPAVVTVTVQEQDMRISTDVLEKRIM